MRFLSVGPPPSPRISVAGALSAESRGEESAAHRIRGLRWRACGVGRAESPKRDGGRTGGGYEGAAMYAPREPSQARLERATPWAYDPRRTRVDGGGALHGVRARGDRRLPRHPGLHEEREPGA